MVLDHVDRPGGLTHRTEDGEALVEQRPGVGVVALVDDDVSEHLEPERQPARSPSCRRIVRLSEQRPRFGEIGLIGGDAGLIVGAAASPAISRHPEQGDALVVQPTRLDEVLSKTGDDPRLLKSTARRACRPRHGG